MSNSSATENTNSTATEWQTVEKQLYEPGTNTELTSIIIELVAAAEETEITKLKGSSMYDVVDVEAVEAALFGRADTSGGGVDGSLTFEYRRYRITISSDGWVQVAAPDRS